MGPGPEFLFVYLRMVWSCFALPFIGYAWVRIPINMVCGSFVKVSQPKFYNFYSNSVYLVTQSLMLFCELMQLDVTSR